MHRRSFIPQHTLSIATLHKGVILNRFFQREMRTVFHNMPGFANSLPLVPVFVTFLFLLFIPFTPIPTGRQPKHINPTPVAYVGCPWVQMTPGSRAGGHRPSLPPLAPPSPAASLSTAILRVGEATHSLPGFQKTL